MGTRMQAGFTLLELLIIIAIIGILASVAAINFPRSTASAEVASANTELQNVNTAKLGFYGAEQRWPASTVDTGFDRYLVGEPRVIYVMSPDNGLVTDIVYSSSENPWPSSIQFNSDTQLWEKAE